MMRILMSAVAFSLMLSCVFAEGLIRNPGFDSEGGAWTLGKGFSLAKGEGHNGSGGLVWQSNVPLAKTQFAVQEIEGLKGGDRFDFSVLMRCDGFKKTSNQGAVVSIEMRDASNKWICAVYARKPKKDPPGEWTLAKKSGQVPLNAKHIRVAIYVSGDSTGLVAWDNFSLTKCKEEPVDFVCTSAYRNMATGGVVRVNASIRRPQDARGFFRFANAAGENVRVPAEGMTDDSASLTLPVESLASGTHDIRFELVSGDRVVGSAAVPFTRLSAYPDRAVWIDEYGRCIVRGRPFFPMGMYWNPNESRLPVYTNGPFNCVIHYDLPSNAKLDMCQRAGLMSFAKVDAVVWEKAIDPLTSAQDATNALTKIGESVRRVARHPAFLAWYVGDELPVSVIPSQVRLKAFLAENDPDHPTYAVQDRTYDLRAFLPTADVFGLDPYPVSAKPMRLVADMVRAGREALFDARPMWGVPQAFSWQWYRPQVRDTERFPTVAEMRSICWQHIACGANGLLSFSMSRLFGKDNPGDWHQQWADICAAHAEVAKQIPVLLSVEPAPQATSSSPEVICRTWVKDGDLYLLACNLSDKVIDATITLSSGAWIVRGMEIGSGIERTGERSVRLQAAPIAVVLARLSPVVFGGALK